MLGRRHNQFQSVCKVWSDETSAAFFSDSFRRCRSRQEQHLLIGELVRKLVKRSPKLDAPFRIADATMRPKRSRGERRGNIILLFARDA